METVLGNASARLAVQTEPWLHDTIAVVTYQATAVGGNPKEPIGIHEDIADMVMGETVAQVEGCQVVTVCEQVASVNYRGVWSVECGVRILLLLILPSEVISLLTPPSSLLTPHHKVDFANFHSQLENDTFRKIVLARCADEVLEEKVKPIELFYRACALYPRLFVALVDTAKSGCWLTATPEILLDRNGED